MVRTNFQAMERDAMENDDYYDIEDADDIPDYALEGLKEELRQKYLRQFGDVSFGMNPSMQLGWIRNVTGEVQSSAWFWLMIFMWSMD